MKSKRKTKAQLIKELEALRKINTTIGTLLDLNAVLQRIIDEIVPLFAAQAASVILFDYAKQEAEITTVYGTRPQHGEPFRYQWPGSLAGWVVEHKRPLRLSRPLPSEWPTSAKLAEELGGSLETISVLLAPLSMNGEVLGCLEVVWNPQRAITDGDEQLLEAVATQVAIAIANARLYTERQRTEAALRSAKEYAETLIKSSIDMIVAVNTQRRITEFNPAAEKGFGYQRAEVIGQPVDLLYADASPGPDINRQVRTTGRYIGEVRNKRKNGEIFDVHLEASLLHDVAGNVVGVMGISRDITDRKRAEDALRASEERYRIVSQCISDYAFSFRMEDGKTPFLEWITDSFTRVTGYPTSSVLGKSNPWARYMHPQDLERVNATILQMQPNVSSTYEFRLLRNDGEIRWIRSSAYIVRDEKNAVTRLYGAAQDMTERKHAEDALQYQRAFEQLVANISKDFLNLAPEEIDTGISRALQAVGEFSGIDRSYLFLFRENLAIMDNTHEWCAPGIASEQSKLQDMATSTFPWFVKKLVAFEAIYIPDVSALPLEARAEQVEFQSQGMQSLVSIPLVSGKTVIGLLAFAAVRTTKCWTEESLLLLKVVGEMIANALERKWAAERQQHLHAQLLQTQKVSTLNSKATRKIAKIS